MIDEYRLPGKNAAMAARGPALVLLEPEVDCCAPLGAAPLTSVEAEELSRRLKALADPARLRLLSLLMAAPDGQACTCDLTEPLGLSQPTVSHHLKKLAESGLVTGQRRGVWTFYRVNRDALAAAARVLAPEPAKA